jgi:hypothetical protein
MEYSLKNIKYNEYINKMLLIKIHDRDNEGKIDNNSFTFIKGFCTFAGYNKSLDLNQITINRIPLFESDILEVKIINE